MRSTKAGSYCLAVLVVLGMQSLADVARKEAERRKLLEQQGIEERVVERNEASSAPNGSITVSTSPSEVRQKERSSPPKGGRTARSYRTTIQKLDRAIRQNEERLESQRARLQASRWAIPKVGRVSARSRASDSQEQLQRKIDELQIKLNQLRQERAEVYEEGKKAGFLPGELDGKGIIP